MLSPRFSPMETRWPACRGRGSKTRQLDAEEPSPRRSGRRRGPPAAQTVAELGIEIDLSELVDLAKAVSDGGEDRKWTELRSLLLDDPLLQSDSSPPGLIIFAEHRDCPQLPDPPKSATSWAVPMP